jgi:hypothetical protein
MKVLGSTLDVVKVGLAFPYFIPYVCLSPEVLAIYMYIYRDLSQTDAPAQRALHVDTIVLAMHTPPRPWTLWEEEEAYGWTYLNSK